MDRTAIIRKRLGILISLSLLVVVVATFLTGYIAAALDLNRFVYHKYAAYLAIGLAALHVVLHWRALTGQVRRWLLNRTAPMPAAARPVDRSSSPGLSRRALLWPGLAFAAGAGVGRWTGATAAPVTLEAGDDLGQIYHHWSMTSYRGALLKSFHVRAQPPVYKHYPQVPVVPLPPVPPPAGPPIEQVLLARRSRRDYADRPISPDELSRLLLYSTGISDRRDPTLAFRSVPSSGALFPIEVYLAIFDVRGIEPGIYHYGVEAHALELLRPGDFRRQIFHAAVSQEMVLHAGVVVILTGLFARVQWKYVDRSYRYVMLEAGHLGQNVYLTATGLGLGPCGIGAFLDDEVNDLVGVDGHDEAALYLLSVGSLPPSA